MNFIIKSISLCAALLLISMTATAESLYASNIQSRLADTDKDGVIDARDLCSDTKPGAAVNHKGCPDESTKLLSVELNILFDTGKAEVKSSFYPEVRKLAVLLKEHPNSSAVIEGHTDDRGSVAANRLLSQKRATAIKDILVDSFRIKANRIKSIGYGEARPIASNDTSEGRKTNRRVVADVFAQSVTEKKRWTIYSVDQSRNTALYSTR
ncbi:OmpA family protein [Marinomonas transparens]|uniref:OmpA family protein n=1 Tax=Marinomonas transparens TaxID=2795388 RepID=A0A934MZJ0_9GAMM|nr:OmpA family protein [Marinomonas transparens]MBJ7537595.1 OmpA family protein [Marinomonas transparens]